MASFILRNVDTALWTAARQACKAEQVQLVTLIETYLAQWLSKDEHEPKSLAVGDYRVTFYRTRLPEQQNGKP